jgi:hypothetical protein
MLFATHTGGHLRPDMVGYTGVWEPYPIRQRNPVDIARQTINPFINGIRPSGVLIAEPQPEPEHIAQAAIAVVMQWARGQAANISCNGKNVKAKATDQQVAPPGSVAQSVVDTAKLLARGVPATVTSRGRSVVARPPQAGGTTGLGGLGADHRSVYPGSPSLPMTQWTDQAYAVVQQADALSRAARDSEAERRALLLAAARGTAAVPQVPGHPGSLEQQAAWANQRFLRQGVGPGPSWYEQSRTAQFHAAHRAVR